MKQEFTFTSSDKISKIHGVKWIPEGEVKAIIQISHGMTEFIERYEDFALYLNSHGFLVVGNDHIGHGKSAGNSENFGYFGECDGGGIIVNDLHRITVKIRNEYPTLPFFLLGHSMGSFMARRYIINYSGDIDGAIIMGTGNQSALMLGFGRTLTGFLTNLKGSRYRSSLVSFLCFSNYNSRVPKNTGNWQTRDIEILNGIKDLPETNFTFTVSAFKQMFDTIAYVENEENISKIRKDLPILVISGTADPVGDYGKGVKKCHRAFASCGITDLTLKLIDGARHEIINETDRTDTYKYIKNWLLCHMSENLC